MGKGNRKKNDAPRLRPETKKSIWAIALIGIALILILANLHIAGPAGEIIYNSLSLFFGWGYLVLPASLLAIAIVFLVSKEQKIMGFAAIGASLFMLTALGFIELVSPGHGGWLGLLLSSLRIPFGKTAAIIVNLLVMAIAALMALDVPLKFEWLKRKPETAIPDDETEIEKPIDNHEEEEAEARDAEETEIAKEPQSKIKNVFGIGKKGISFHGKNYVPPPLSLLKSSIEKPTTGDLRANANIIKRTLESFGIAVEMGEINIGPKVTRYTLKPAEGIKLSRITALHQDLALALAAHPIRIEAPIPGKSLVGIEVPNKFAALVRLGSLMGYPEFQKSGSLAFILGRDVTGEPVLADIDRMPHLMVAGATGSGKSVTIHSILVSLLYKNAPETLRLILVDPKRVELSVYEGIPHLVSPVIAESKKALGVFRWAINEMERRYDLLLGAGSRDIKSYNANGGKDEPLPYLLIVVDELADLMTTYGREVEGSIIRLAQMARATGIHLILSTQRPSVEVITGLIKANITSRIALQVASQVDSRTILDTSGAEKLLGGGDLLFISSELSKPKRIQSAYVTEEEVSSVAAFVRDNNRVEASDEAIDFKEEAKANEGLFDEYLEDGEDELYDEAVKVVSEAKKASASLLQRRLKVGYARAARLLDLMESQGLIGPGDGAKPREVFTDNMRREA